MLVILLMINRMLLFLDEDIMKIFLLFLQIDTGTALKQTTMTNETETFDSVDDDDDDDLEEGDVLNRKYMVSSYSFSEQPLSGIFYDFVFMLIM